MFRALYRQIARFLNWVNGTGSTPTDASRLIREAQEHRDQMLWRLHGRLGLKLAGMMLAGLPVLADAVDGARRHRPGDRRRRARQPARACARADGVALLALTIDERAIILGRARRPAGRARRTSRRAAERAPVAATRGARRLTRDRRPASRSRRSERVAQRFETG